VNYPKRGDNREVARARPAYGVLVAAIRERLSGALLKFGTEAAMDRLTLQRSLAAASDTRGGDALGALEAARWFEVAVLWVGWRLQPRHLLGPR
jgi:hypothetical protein